MKSGVLNHIKFSRLKRRLKLRIWEAVGVLETLWQVTATNAPAGDIGRFTDEDIAVQLDWDGDETALVAALVETGWLDRHDQHRLVVHDWADHCPNWLRASLKRHGREFVGGPPADLPQGTPTKDGPQASQGTPTKDGPQGTDPPIPTPTPNQNQSPKTPPSRAASGAGGDFMDMPVPENWDPQTTLDAAVKWLRRRPAFSRDDLVDAFHEHATAQDFAMAVDRAIGRGWQSIVPLREADRLELSASVPPNARDGPWRDVDAAEWEEQRRIIAERKAQRDGGQGADQCGD